MLATPTLWFRFEYRTWNVGKDTISRESSDKVEIFSEELPPGSVAALRNYEYPPTVNRVFRSTIEEV
jgi:hypothetical protein